MALGVWMPLSSVFSVLLLVFSLPVAWSMLATGHTLDRA